MQFHLINIRPKLHHQNWRKLRVTLLVNMLTVPNFLNFDINKCCSSSNFHLETLLLTVVCGNLYIHTDFWSKFCLLYWTASKLPRLLDTVSKLALFSMPGLKEEKLTKNANLHENWNIQILFLPNFIKIDRYNFELYRFKVGAFFDM